MENNDNRVFDFFKKGILSDKTVIRLLIAMICILLLYIVGMRFVNFNEKTYLATTSEIEKQTQLDEAYTSEANILKVNINTDNIFELCQLSGIGESKANKILEYRKENGNFSDIEELRNVSGIGEKIYEKIKDYIYVGE